MLSARPPPAAGALAAGAVPAHFGHDAPSAIWVPQFGQNGMKASKGEVELHGPAIELAGCFPGGAQRKVARTLSELAPGRNDEFGRPWTAGNLEERRSGSGFCFPERSQVEH